MSFFQSSKELAFYQRMQKQFSATPMEDNAYFRQAGLIAFRFPFSAKVICIFTTAPFGNLSLEACAEEEEQEYTQSTRSALLHTLSLSAWSELHQVHGATVIFNAEPSFPGKTDLPEGDGLSTTLSGLGLAIKTADCQPILLAHVKGKFIAALHVGWRANAAEFIQKALADLCGLHSVKPSELFAVRGPSLGPSAAEFLHFHQEWPSGFDAFFDVQRQTVDLWSLSKSQLLHAGVPENQIFSLDLCTFLLTPLFFSHRRGHRGRQMALIWKK